MSASHNIFAAQNKPFDLYYLIENFKLQHDEYYRNTLLPGENNYYMDDISILERPDDYKIALGKYFTPQLKKFFSDHHVEIHHDLEENELHIQRENLDNSSLTYRDAHDFLFQLGQHINALVENSQEPERSHSPRI